VSDGVLDTTRLGRESPGAWFAQELASLNGVRLRFRVMRDTAAGFHVHETSPECFFVLSGSVTIDTEHGSCVLEPGQFYRVAPGVSHRARVDGEATLLVLDAFETQPGAASR
jgi:mannose-6-phosphate isomerase-like protein (cupin superfamily)